MMMMMMTMTMMMMINIRLLQLLGTQCWALKYWFILFLGRL